jgi:tripartite-type tricarboxylate transporter receptor subunit TctC
MKSLAKKVMLSASLAVVVLSIGAHTAFAQKPFYQGKTLKLMVDFSAGGPTDIECRLYARYLKKYLKGDPTIVVMNRPGGAGTLAMNWLYERARKNGTVMGCQTASGRYQEWYVGDPKAVGLRANMEEVIPVMFTPVISVGVSKTNLPPGVKRPEDLKNVEKFTVGGFRSDSSKDLKFRALFDLAGVKYKYVTGYQGSSGLLAAFMRDEIDYVDGSTPFYLTRVKPISVDTGSAIPIWYGSDETLPAISPGVTAAEFVKRLSGKAPSGDLWKLYQIGSSYRQILAPPGTPPAAVAAVREAFNEMGKDPQFLAEYEKVVGIEPTFVTKPEALEKALEPWKTAGDEIKQFRLKYIDEGRKLAGES